jgi:endonuclease/exonuclease/phosphatase family metal-dependent hydrolase
MNSDPTTPAAAVPATLATLMVANGNLLNLALPGRAFYANQDVYGADEYARKREAVLVPDMGLHARFERPVLHAALRTRPGRLLHVLVVHLKSKRPKYLQDADGNALEDRNDPRITVRATLRSLVMRGAEAAALRGIVLGLVQRTRDPLILLGDMNDSPHAVTCQMIAATQAVAYDRHARDTALFHAYDVQTEAALKRDMAYSHVHQGWPEILDQIWVSEEFVPGTRFAVGDVRRVEYFNDHLQESRERFRSDHGFVRALLRVRSDGGNGTGGGANG